MSTSVGIQFNPSQRPGVVLCLDPWDGERLRVRPRLGLGRLALAFVLLAAGAYGQLEAWRDGAWGVFVFTTLPAWGGVALVALRRRLVLDRREGVVKHWRGMLLRHFPHRVSLADFDRVRVTLGSEGDGSRTTTTYPVQLEGRDQTLELDTPGYWEPARQLAEELAAFLGLPIHDEDRSGKLQPEELDRTVGRRGRHLNPVAEPKQPACRIEEQRDDLLRVRIPPPGYQPFLGLSVIVGLFFMIPLTVELFVPLLRGRQIAWTTVALPLFLPLWVFYESARAVLANGGILEVTPGTLRLALRRPWGARAVTIPAAELEDLVILRPEMGGPRSLMAYFAPAVLVARSDRESVRFGYGLSRDELVWLRSRIASVLGGREDPAPRPKRHVRAPRWRWTLAGLGIGMLAAHVTRGPLTRCFAVPLLQHVFSVGACLGVAAGLLIDRLGRRSLGPAVIAALVALLLTAGWREGHDFVEERPFLQDLGGFQNSFKRHESRGAQQRFLAGFLPVAALLNLAGLELALALCERWRSRANLPGSSKNARP